MDGSESLRLEDARKIEGPVLYAFEDHRGVFYIGRTVDLKRRLYRHLGKQFSNVHVAKRLRNAGKNLRVRVIETEPKLFAEAERTAITQHSATLLNIVLNPFQYKTWSPVPAHDKNCGPLPLCIRCYAPRPDLRDKYCASCSKEFEAQRSVNAKQDLRKSTEKLVADFMLKKAA